MSFVGLRPGESYFNPITDEIGTVKVQLVNGQSFGNAKFFEDADVTTPPVGKFADGGVGYKLVNDGDRLGLPAYKKAVVIAGFFSKNLSGATLSKVDAAGTVTVINSFPLTLLPGEDLQFAGTATDADNYAAVQMRAEQRYSF